MEINDFDQLIKTRISEAKPHDKAIQNSQPYLWGAVHQEINTPKRERKWYLIAAAVMLLFFAFGSVLFWQMQKQYQVELALLKVKLQQLNAQNDKQIANLEAKNVEISTIKSALAAIEDRVEEPNKQLTPDLIKREIIVERDTIFIEKVIEKEAAAPIEQFAQLKNEEVSEANSEHEQKINKTVAIFPKSQRSTKVKTSSNSTSLRLAQLSKP